MKTSLTTRFAALAALIFVSFTIVNLAPSHALPDAPTIELTEAAPYA